MDRFLSDEQIAELHGLMRTGFNTVQAFQDPQPVVQFRRLSAISGRFEDYGDPVTLIRVKFGLREKSLTSQMVPLQDVRSDGDIAFWADDIDVQVGDRFDWQGHTLMVTATFPARFGVQKAEVKLSQ